MTVHDTHITITPYSAKWQFRITCTCGRGGLPWVRLGFDSEDAALAGADLASKGHASVWHTEAQEARR